MLKAEVKGNLGADAVVKDVNGNKFVTFRVAHTDKWTGEDKVTHTNTQWVDVILNNVESKVIPYLKQGVQVFVRGNLTARIYSSPKERQMKAGLQINASEIELCGGQSDSVPRQLIDPDTGALADTTKYYWCNASTKGMKSGTYKKLLDTKGNGYVMNHKGFVIPEASNEQGAQGDVQADEQTQSE